MISTLAYPIASQHSATSPPAATERPPPSMAPSGRARRCGCQDTRSATYRLRWRCGRPASRFGSPSGGRQPAACIGASCVAPLTRMPRWAVSCAPGSPPRASPTKACCRRSREVRRWRRPASGSIVSLKVRRPRAGLTHWKRRTCTSSVTAKLNDGQSASVRHRKPWRCELGALQSGQADDPTTLIALQAQPTARAI